MSANDYMSTVTFLLTHLLRGVTMAIIDMADNANISTHTPLARCDLGAGRGQHGKRDFYSHTSCEV